ncbi:hypothetical protein OIU34_38560 [Pararhizobium sp. BT-229]|uniref:hypothetical protein n=1 Tax=Pararhizobium sp. BT-229 TaxID=2986923 RepID=UPI0021F77F28|nr:hypothetical protein [Pararhizobium sp. BT-229]MCV9967726.1 hypothetical protein [Pararhizobium sp. BT-229]
MTGAEIMAVVGFFLTISGAGWAVRWRVEGKVARAAAKGEKAIEDLAAHKLNAAETFATKQGMQAQTAQLLRAIEGVSGRIDGVHERLDRMFERLTTRRTTTQ